MHLTRLLLSLGASHAAKRVITVPQYTLARITTKTGVRRPSFRPLPYPHPQLEACGQYQSGHPAYILTFGGMGTIAAAAAGGFLFAEKRAAARLPAVALTVVGALLVTLG